MTIETGRFCQSCVILELSHTPISLSLPYCLLNTNSNKNKNLQLINYFKGKIEIEMKFL